MLMGDKQRKQEKLKKLKRKVYTIFGIFNFKSEELVYINISQEMVELEYDMSDYDETIFDIVSFKVSLT